MSDSRGPRPLRLPPIEVPRPHQLQRLATELTRRAIAQPRADTLREARALLQSALSGKPIEVGRPRLARALVALLDEKRSAKARGKIAELVLTSGLGRARELFVLWQEVRETRPQATEALQTLIGQRAPQRHSSGALAFLPPWISRTNAEQRHVALLSPEAVFLPYLHGRRRTVGELDDSLGGVLPGSDLGIELMTRGLRAAPAPWWSGLGTPVAVRAWAKARHEHIQAVVAERQLLAIRAQTLNVIALADEAEAQALTAWVLELLGDPEDYPARWCDISDDAREVFEWLLVRNEILKILDAFRRGASKRERAEFWAGYAPQMRDARYVELDGTAVCMMVIKNLFVIEFGDTGNAAYIYQKSESLPRLRRLKDLPRLVPSYKDRSELQLARHRFPHLDRIIHNGAWAYGAHNKLRRASRGAIQDPDRRAAAHVSRWGAEHATHVQSPLSQPVTAGPPAPEPAASERRLYGADAASVTRATGPHGSVFGAGATGGPGPAAPRQTVRGTSAADIEAVRTPPEPAPRPLSRPTPHRRGHTIDQAALRGVRARVKEAREIIAWLEMLEKVSDWSSHRIYKRKQAELENAVAAAQRIASASRLPGISIWLDEGHLVVEDPNGLIGSGGWD